MKMRKYSFILPLLLLMACNSGTQREDLIPVVPEIAINEVNPKIVKAGEDALIFEVSYTDGDGDLGSNDDQIRNVFLTDTRIGVIHEFRLRQLAPDGADVPITGSFNVTLPFTIMTDSTSDSERVIFSLYITDRAGNQSNTTESEEITVIR